MQASLFICASLLSVQASALTHLTAVVGGGWVPGTGNYPSTYPLQNEVYQPPDLPVTEPPVGNGDQNNPGGFVRAYAEFMDVEGCEFPFAPCDGCRAPGQVEGNVNMASWSFIHVYSSTAYFTFDTWNCTAVFAPSNFFGTVDGNAVCEAGACCSDIYNMPAYAGDFEEAHTWISTFSATGLCDVPNERAYCGLVCMDCQVNCFQWYIDESARMVVTECYDSQVLWYLTCKVYKASPYEANAHGIDCEPAAYDATLTTEQAFKVAALWMQTDRVCHPYSYYHPAETEATTPSSSTPSTGSPAASDADSSGSSELNMILAVAFAAPLA